MLKTESNLSQTTERAAALLDELRLRLDVRTPPPAADPLDQELQAYFAVSANTSLDEIRKRVIEGVVDRILKAWDRPRTKGSSSMETAVVNRLIDRVLEKLGEDSNRAGPSGPAPTRR